MSSALDILDELEGDSEEDAEAMTAADVLQKLEEVSTRPLLPVDSKAYYRCT